MHLPTTLNVVFWLACLTGIIFPLIRSVSHERMTPKTLQDKFNSFVWGLPILLLAYLAAFLLKWDHLGTISYALSGFMASWVLACLTLSRGLKGIALLIPAFLIGDIHALPNLNPGTGMLSLIAYLYGILTAHWVNPKPKTENFILPAIFCVGLYWIQAGTPESWHHTYQIILTLALSILLIVRTLQELPMFPTNPTVQACLIVSLTGLLGWLGLQTFLLQPALYHWALLMAGGSLLSFLLGDRLARQTSLPKIVMYVVLAGVATLVTSRLYGTIGWIVLAPFLLAQLKASTAARLISLFLIARVILQAFIYQFNPNVTGINITHPYASAALYAGFVLMILLPRILSLVTRFDASKNEEHSPITLSLFALTGVVIAGLSNYFFHAEATGSFLTALLVAGFGVSLLSPILSPANRFYPILLSILMSLTCLLTHPLIAAGNTADKPEKLWVLGAMLILTLILVGFSAKKVLRKNITGSAGTHPAKSFAHPEKL